MIAVGILPLHIKLLYNEQTQKTESEWRGGRVAASKRADQRVEREIKRKESHVYVGDGL